MIHILSTLRGSTEFVQARMASLPHVSPTDPQSTCPVRAGEAAFVGTLDGHAVARAVAQPLEGHPGCGNIALFECIDHPLLASRLLAACEAHLAGLGCRTVIGPLDGDTWHAYRTADPSPEPPFLLDRATPAWAGSLFHQSGYRVCDRYLSTWIPREHLAWSRLDSHLRRLEAHGVAVRPLDASDWDRELERLHALSLRAFADNSWASGLDLDGFRRLYDPWKGRLPTDGIFLASRGDELLAYLVSCPEPLPDGSCRTILKTVATSGHPLARGLGSLLGEAAHRMAYQRGHSGVIHALMHEHNPSTRILSRKGRILRTYCLWRKDLS